MTPEERIEHMKEMPRIREICTVCEHSGMGIEFQGVIPEQICKLAPLPLDEIEEPLEDLQEFYGTETPTIYDYPENLKRCPTGKW